MPTQENKEAKEAHTKSSSWTNDDLIDLIRAVKFSNKDLSMRVVHTEITTVMAKNESFEFLADIKLNDVKKVWKKALSGATKPSEKKDAAAAAAPANDAHILPKTKGILKFYTVGDGSVKSLANDYTMAVAAAEIVAGAPAKEKENDDNLNNYVHCFLDVPADKSGTKPHQALINFNDNKSGSKKAGGKTKNKVKGAGAAVDSNEDGREIVKIQMAAPMPGKEDEKSVMLLYNADRTARTFIHPDSGDDGGYDKIQSLISNQGKCGVLDGGGLKAYFYARITRRIADQDIISIDVTSGLAQSQSW